MSLHTPSVHYYSQPPWSDAQVKAREPLPPVSRPVRSRSPKDYASPMRSSVTLLLAIAVLVAVLVIATLYH